jgi:hypothetical protein
MTACSPAVLILLGSVVTRPAEAASPRTRSYLVGAPGVSIRVAVGYANIYRGNSWTPVRVTLRNTTGSDIDGLLKIPQSNQSSSVGTIPAFHGMYQDPVLLPAETTKQVTVYVPGSGVQGRVSVLFVRGHTVLGTASAYPTGVDNGTLLIGALAGSPGDFAWVGPAVQQRVTTHVIPLSAATLDSNARALGAFDIIVLTDVDSSQLDAAQLSALQGYVENGGSLLLVGGATWQKTLRPLPLGLLPGRLAGARVLPNLRGLRSLTTGPGNGGGRSVVSVMNQVTGTVWASQDGVPLVIRRQVGQGVIDYLAFDPAGSALPSGAGLTQHLVAMAAPLAVTRTWSPQGFRARFEAIFKNMALTDELANVPPATMPLLAIFAALTLLYVLILGPANFLILRRLGHQQLALVSIPALSLLYLGSMGGVATHLEGRTASINTISEITLRGSSPARPATMYVSLAAPLPASYHLGYSASALPAALPQVTSPAGFSPRGASTLHSTPLGMRLQEGPQAGASLLSVDRWGTRDLTLDTSLDVPGSVRADLAVDAHGTIVGSIHNGTNLVIQSPVLVAGEAFVHLPDIVAGATIHVRVRPSVEPFGQDAASIWGSLYGSSGGGFSDGFGGFGFGDCCDQAALQQEDTSLVQEQNAISMLSRAQDLPLPAGVFLTGWSRKPLAPLTVDGTTPQRRDLAFLFVPLSVHFPSRGPFRLLPNTLTSQLVDVLPRAPHSCCSGFGGFGGFGGPDTPQQVSVGQGGSLTFEFDIPNARHVHFRQLSVSPGNRSDNIGPARVYDWQAGRWASVNLSIGTVRLPRPDRFVSPGGQVLVKLESTSVIGDLTISDQNHAVDLSGSGVVS